MVSMLGLVTCLELIPERSRFDGNIGSCQKPQFVKSHGRNGKFYVARITGPQDADVAGSPMQWH